MDWLNYHHLLYFWTVAREGTVAKASKKLLLSQSTISGQIRTLERSLHVKLFERVGRNLVLTDAGRVVYRYADEIFALGQDLCANLEGGANRRLSRVEVGVADVLPRWIVYQLLMPALQLREPIQLICHDDKTERLLTRLALNELDVVLTDVPAGPLVKIRAYNHLLGECGISFLASTKLAKRYRRGFPRSLDGAPFLLPMEGTALRANLATAICSKPSHMGAPAFLPLPRYWNNGSAGNSPSKLWGEWRQFAKNTTRYRPNES
jgi:LysR family transcriptional activator of nhaA